MRGDVRAGKKLTLDERFVNALTQPLDVRRVDEELAAEQRGGSARVSERVRRRDSTPAVLCQQRQGLCVANSSISSGGFEQSETRSESTNASVPALTSMSVMTCHRSIATTHLLSRRRQLRVLCQDQERARATGENSSEMHLTSTTSLSLPTFSASRRNRSSSNRALGKRYEVTITCVDACEFRHIPQTTAAPGSAPSRRLRRATPARSTR